MKASSEFHRSKRLSYIAAATAALRRRVDALRDAAEPEAESGDYFRVEDVLMAETVMAELKNVKEQLKPLASLAAEFKQKWDKRRSQLLSLREADIASHLKSESEAMAERAELAAGEEMRAVAWASEAASQEAAQKLSAGHRPELETTVGLWRDRVGGANAVKYSDVDKALRHALQRVADWAADEERQTMTNWTAEISRIVTTAHSLDEEVLMAAEDTQSARRAVLEGALHRHSKGLSAFRAELQDRIASSVEELHELPADSVRKRRAHPIAAAHLAKQAQSRLKHARMEANNALDAQQTSAEEVIDAAAQRELNRCRNFSQAMSEVGPRLKRSLDDELRRVREAFQAAQAANAAAHVSVTEDGQAVTFMDSSPFSRFGGRLASRRSTMNRNRRSIVPGAAPTTRASNFQVGEAAFLRGEGRDADGGRGSRTESVGSDEYISPSGIGQDDEDDSDSDDSMDSEREAQMLRIERMQEVDRLRQRLQKAQVAVGKGDWHGDWRVDLSEVVSVGRSGLRDCEAALEGQANVFKRGKHAAEDLSGFSDTFMDLAEKAKLHTQSLRGEMVKIRNAKAGLAMSRMDLVKSLLERQEEDTAGLEHATLPLISKLTREAEICVEVGKAMQREQHFPVRVVAGSWRRAVGASLPILARVWDSCRADKEHQHEFLGKLLAVLAKTPEGAAHLEKHASEAVTMRHALSLNTVNSDTGARQSLRSIQSVGAWR